jgi:glutaminyl-peptide cyclotransferase
MMARTLIVLALVAQATAAVKFDSGRAWADLRQLVAIGPRPAGSAGIEQSRTYMKDQLAAAGVAVAEQAWDDETPLGKVRMVNLVATIPGARKERLVIAGHYDTKLFRQFRFVGASDGGSSAAFLLELARVFKARRNPLTIELLFLDGEEAVVEWRGTDHTYGSRHYVEVARKDGSLSSLKALILIDMIGDRDLQIRRDTNSTAWLTDTIWETARRQQLDNVFIAESATIEDDHLPFLQAGVPAVQIIDLDYEPWHTPRDTLEAVSARSLQIVGDVLLAALPQIEARIDPEHRGKRGRSRDKALERLDARLSHELLVGVKGKRTRG